MDYLLRLKTDHNMKLSQSILSEITQVLRDIKDHYPELQKYLDERPMTLPDENNPNAKVDDDVLKEYLSSLNNLVNKYKEEH